MITWINELKTLTKYVSYKCKCKFDGRKCNSNQEWMRVNVDASAKNTTYVRKIIFGILLHVVANTLNI